MNTAILFDTMSIQPYVFGSNRLKDNLGASYIVEHVYDFFKKRAKENPNDLEIGYIGGGNALVFTNTEKMDKIIKEYTASLLYSFPGVNVAFATQQNFDLSNYRQSIKTIFRRLAENKRKYLPITEISSHGITATCQYSSLSVEIINKYENDSIDIISSAIASKRIWEDIAREEEISLLKHKNADKELENYHFPDQFDHLGQRKNEDSHIAVVHIDGNGFGNVFRNLKSLQETKILSNKVKECVQESFVYALNQFIPIIPSVTPLLEGYTVFDNSLPIRPIILGGDDVTFVCHGKLGIWFAEKFMEEFSKNYIDDQNKMPFSSCAGVAVVKTKYPFYRAYQLAEELCHSAKSRRKKYMDMNNIDDGGNWIDFQLAYSGLGNTLEEVRRLQYDVEGFKRPYKVENTLEIHSFERLKNLSAKLNATLPNSKIKDLREMLTKDRVSLEDFIEHLKYQHDEKNGFRDQILGNNTTDVIIENIPFFDMIELLELYPTNLISK